MLIVDLEDPRPPRYAVDTVSSRLIYLAALSNALDYSVKIPTLNDYVLSFGGSTFFFGIVLSTFTLGRMVCFPVSFAATTMCMLLESQFAPSLLPDCWLLERPQEPERALCMRMHGDYCG